MHVNLKWNDQTSMVISKANFMPRLLRRNIGDDFDINTKRMLYLAVVRSRLDYASEVWGHQTIGQIYSIGSVQRRASFFILSDVKTLLIVFYV